MYNENNENNELGMQENANSEEKNPVAEEIAQDVTDTTEEAETDKDKEETAEAITNKSVCDKPRKSMSKKTKYTLTFSSVALLFIIAVVVLNLLFSALAGRVNMSIDLTPDKLLDLSDETIEVLDNLEENVGLYSLIPDIEGDVFEAIDKTLLRYQQKSSKIKYTKIDTVLDPQFLASYLKENEQINEYSIIVECGSKHKVVDINNLVVMNQSTGQIEYLAAEQRITSAIMHVTSQAEAKIGIVQDHGEIDYEDFNASVLEAENYEVVAVSLLNGIPEDVDMLIIPSPTQDFHAQEIDAVDAFFDKGGKVQVILEAPLANTPVLNSYLAEWGVSVYSDAYVYEQSPSDYMSYPTNVIAQAEYSEITENFIDNIGMLIYPMAKGIKIDEVHSVESKKLLTSSETSFAKMNNKTSSAAKEEGDIDGPITLAALLTRYSPDGSPMLMVMGGSGFFQTFGVSSFGNADFYYNMLSYMTDGGESMFIRPKDISPTFLAIPAIDAIVLSLVVVIVVPLVILIAGFVIWRRRRHL